MKRALLVASLVLCSLGAHHARAATPTWSTNTALPVQEDRWEFGLFHPLHWGVSERVELSTHPLLTLVMPHLDAKVLWLSDGPLHVATRHGVSYPSLLLNQLAREGAGGLLPPTADIPQGVVLESGLLVTVALHETHWLTAETGVSVAPRSAGDMPVLDFPFLYPRFAALSSTASGQWGLAVEGVLWGQLAYTLDVDLWAFDITPGGWAFEQGLSVTWQISDHVGIALGYRLSHARYPAGEQFHFLPYLDLLFGL